MLVRVADGVHVHTSAFIQTNTVVVSAPEGVVLVDPGLTERELLSIADSLDDLGVAVVAGFSTHPHWDHALWHSRFGTAPRYGTELCAATLRELLLQDGWAAQVAEGLPPDIADDVPLELFGQVTGLAGVTRIPWDGPDVQVIEHQAHAPGHAALLIPDRGVLVAGDMLSDVLIPMLNLHGAFDPIQDYFDALDLIEGVAEQVSVVVPGHGSVGGAEELRARIDRDRAYLLAVRDGREVGDARVGPAAEPGWEWVSGVHAWQLQSLGQR